MMVGEVEANDILGRKAWVANLLLILFEIITVILLMNLMISLAVGDVNELRIMAEERLLRIKVNFCIEALHLSEQMTLFEVFGFKALHKTPTNNILTIFKNDDRAFSKHGMENKPRFFDATSQIQKSDAGQEKVYNVLLSTTGFKLRKEDITNKATLTSIQSCTLRVIETPQSGIRTMRNIEYFKEMDDLTDDERCWRKFQRWFIGLNWQALSLI